MGIHLQSIPSAARVPRATYRLQFNEHFRLPDGLALVPYLQELGISHVYASPLLKAYPHSTHGYDVCDFTQLNPELGTEDDLAEFVAALHNRGMGLVLDIVPNHMGIGGPENRWWWDVLTYGPASSFADYFDIDWESAEPRSRGKVILPVLGERYERVLERGEFHLAIEEGTLVLRYFDRLLPVTPCSLPNGQSSAARPFPATSAAVAEINADPQALNEIVRHQHYIPTCWRDADTELNYRRFFNVSTLAGLRSENEQVFNDTHALIRQWIQKGWLDGLRVDHPDGLRDPGQYLRRLRELAPNGWIVVEKILQPEENLSDVWPVAGSTGYDFLNRVAGLFIDSSGERGLGDFYTEFTGEPADYGALVREKKRLALRQMLATEVKRLTVLLVRIADKARLPRKFSRDELREALTELAVCFPVYRSYVRPEDGVVGETDLAWIEHAASAACRERPDLAAELFNFLSDLLLLKQPGSLASDFVQRFQQLTGPAMAKGVEDTAFYCFNRLAALNEVGGHPGRFGLSVESFHDACRSSQSRWPHTMLATSTHDTKRSEDVRARLSLLSEIPDLWCQTVRRWSALTEPYRRDGWPDRNVEYLFYQTLVGAWPLSLERALAYMEKAVCEARQHTTWTRRNTDYETALREFVTATLGDAEFRHNLESFVAPLTDAGHINSLAQTLVKLTAPGVPDIYQGCELWDLSLVDPDNRRPVDFELRRRLLAELKSLPVEEIWRRRSEGLPKLWLSRKALKLRARRPEWFVGSSSYEALSPRGTKSGHVVAFVRGGNAITVVQRLPLVLKGDWGDTTIELPPGNWRNELGNEPVLEKAMPLASLLRNFPAALLARKDAD